MYFDDGIPVSTHVGVVDVQATNAETGSCRCRETGGSEPGVLLSEMKSFADLAVALS